MFYEKSVICKLDENRPREPHYYLVEKHTESHKKARLWQTYDLKWNCWGDLKALKKFIAMARRFWNLHLIELVLNELNCPENNFENEVSGASLFGAGKNSAEFWKLDFFH